MANGLSVQWPLRNIIGILRSFLQEVTPKRIQNLQIIDVIHLALVDVVQQLGAVCQKDYAVDPVTITQTANVADISAYNFDEILKIVDATNGFCIPKDLEEIECLVDPQQQSSIYWCRRGTKIQFYKGTDISLYGALSMTYSKLPDKKTVLTETIDIKDTYVPLVINLAKVKLFELLNKTVPEELSNQVANAIAQVKASTANEMEQTNMKKGS